MATRTYETTEKQLATINNNFTYHAPLAELDQVQRYEKMRDMFRAFALYLTENCPDSRELSVAMTHLETSLMWANAAIARNEK